MKITEKIKYYMKQKKLTWDDIEERTGLSRQTIALFFRNPGKRTLDVIQKIADAVELPIWELFSPSPPFEEQLKEIMRDLLKEETKKIEIEIPVWLDKLIKTKAKEKNISEKEQIYLLLKSAVQMEQISCPNCSHVFWIEPKTLKFVCPYCYRKVEENLLNSPQ